MGIVRPRGPLFCFLYRDDHAPAGKCKCLLILDLIFGLE